MKEQSVITEEETKAAGAAFWDTNPCGGEWEDYDAFLEWYRQTEPDIFAMLERYNWTGKAVLEVGCGQGVILNYLSTADVRVVGVDMSLQSLRRSQAETAYNSHITLAQGDAERLPFPDASFDIALSIGVLHHTTDTAQGIREIHRTLKPGGVAMVMLYHSGNPKWWSTAVLRSLSRLIDMLTGRPSTLLRFLRSRQEQNNTAGTALLELFGVPILRAFSNREARRMFAPFASVRIMNAAPGFARLADVLPMLRPCTPLLTWIDTYTRPAWGFYQYIEAHK